MPSEDVKRRFPPCPEKRYVLCPGYVKSKTDGQEHFITAGQLAHLHGVNPAECYVRTWGMDPDLVPKHWEKLKHLYPSYHGLYRDAVKD